MGSRWRRKFRHAAHQRTGGPVQLQHAGQPPHSRARHGPGGRRGHLRARGLEHRGLPDGTFSHQPQPRLRRRREQSHRHGGCKVPLAARDHEPLDHAHEWKLPRRSRHLRARLVLRSGRAVAGRASGGRAGIHRHGRPELHPCGQSALGGAARLHLHWRSKLHRPPAAGGVRLLDFSDQPFSRLRLRRLRHHQGHGQGGLRVVGGEHELLDHYHLGRQRQRHGHGQLCGRREPRAGPALRQHRHRGPRLHRLAVGHELRTGAHAGVAPALGQSRDQHQHDQHGLDLRLGGGEHERLDQHPVAVERNHFEQPHLFHHAELRRGDAHRRRHGQRRNSDRHAVGVRAGH